MSGYLNTWFFVASFIPYFLIDRFGRKPLLISMISLSAVVMAVQAGMIYQVDPTRRLQKLRGRAPPPCCSSILGAFAVGFQSTVWVYPSEILPLRLRQRGSSISKRRPTGFSTTWWCRSRRRLSRTSAGAPTSSSPSSTHVGFRASTSSSPRPRACS